MKILITTYHGDTVLTSSVHEVDHIEFGKLMLKIENAIFSDEITCVEIEKEYEL